MFQTDYTICGIAPFNEDVVLLAYIADKISSDSEKSAQHSSSPPQVCLPELRVLRRCNDELSGDALMMTGYEKCKAEDYRLE
jgi:hypothetical protein